MTTGSAWRTAARERSWALIAGPALRAGVVLAFGLTAGIWIYAGVSFGGRITDLEIRRVWQILGLSLAVSAAVAVLSVSYAGRLERRVRDQRDADLQNRLDLGRLSAKLMRVAEEERRTIARELHDEVGQVLTALKVELRIAQNALDGTPTSASVLDEARSAADRALHGVRDLAHALHPAILDDLGLPTATEAYLKGFGRRHGVQATLVHSGLDQRLEPETETAAYRIVQEALTNVAKHAGAKACRVELTRRGTTLTVAIQDDGGGFDLSRPRQSGDGPGLGLIGIRERATQLGGAVRIESTRGHGTRLTADLPARSRTERSGVLGAEGRTA